MVHLNYKGKEKTSEHVINFINKKHMVNTCNLIPIAHSDYNSTDIVNTTVDTNLQTSGQRLFVKMTDLKKNNAILYDTQNPDLFRV